MNLTEIGTDIEKLSEVVKSCKDNTENEFINKYDEFVNYFFTELKKCGETNDENERKTKNSKKKERERATGIEKIKNNINEMISQIETFNQKNDADKNKSRKKFEQKIKKCCDEIYDIGTNTFNLKLKDAPVDEYHQLKNKRSWFSRSIEKISRSSSENDVNETEEEKKLREEIEKLEEELEEKRHKLSELRAERKKKEEEEKKKSNDKKNKKNGEEGEEEKKDEENELNQQEQVSLLDRIDDLLQDGECRQAFELLNNTSLLGIRLLGTNKSKAPRMFIILPDPEKCPNGSKPNYWIKFSNWNKSVFNLNLLCESTGGIIENVENETHLLDTTGYSIRDPYKLISLFGPFLLYSIDTFMESCGDNYPREVIKALGKTKPVDYFISLAHEIQKVIKEERLVHKDEQKNLDELESFIEISRGELETFLKRYDYSNMFGGLDKRNTSEKKVRWVCPKHSKKFK